MTNMTDTRNKQWLVIDSNGYSLRNQTVPNEDAKLSVAPMPVLPDPATRGRIPYEAWQYLYSDEIDAFVHDLQNATEVENYFFQDVPVTTSVDYHALYDSACRWLYVNSPCALRENQEHFPA